MNDPKLSPEAVKALADKVVDAQSIPKKIPDAEDLDGQRNALVGALSTAILLMSTADTTIHILPPVIGELADRLLTQGVRQTEHIDLEAFREIQEATPSWVVDGVRQESVKLPPQLEPTEVEPVEVRTAEAPKCPKRIAAAARAVRR